MYKYILISVALSVTLLAACARAPDDVLRFGLSSPVITLDPRFATDSTSTRVNRLLYQQLVDFDAHYQPVAALAEWQPLSPTHYRFSLSQRAGRFADGTRLDAGDVKATYASVLDKATASPHRGSLAHIAQITVIDDRTIDFQLTHPDALFPGKLVIGILQAERLADGSVSAKQPAGSGGFAFGSWSEDGELRLKRKADGTALQFVVVKNPTVRVLKLLRGEIDMAQGDLPPELLAWLNKRTDIKVTAGRGSNYAYLGFNMEDPLTGQLAFRKAIAYAIDRDAIIDHLMGARARTANGLLTPDHWAGNPALSAYQHSPTLARQWLARVKLPDGTKPHLVYKTSSDPFRVRLATVFQHQLAAFGIDVDIRSYDWGTFYGDIKAGNFQIYSLAWVGIKMPDIFDYVFASSAIPPHGANRGRLRDARIDALLAQAQSTTDLEALATLYREVQAEVHEQLPFVPLWYEDQVFVSRRDITGYTVARDGNYDGLLAVRRAH